VDRVDAGAVRHRDAGDRQHRGEGEEQQCPAWP